jgi:hypothetical protein
MRDETSDEALKITLRASRDMRPPGSDKEAADNAVIARNVLHTELGYYADEQREYNLDQATRDRLIVHTRQDAAHALLNTITIMNDVRRTNRRYRNTWVGLILVCVAGIALWFWNVGQR